MQIYYTQDTADFEMGDDDSNEGGMAWINGDQSAYIDREAGVRSMSIGSEKQIAVLIINCLTAHAGNDMFLGEFSGKLARLLMAGLG